MFSTASKSKGFTLLELLLAIGISLLIAVGVFNTYRSIDRDTKVTQSAALVEMLFRQGNNITAQNNNFTVPRAGGADASLSTSLFLADLGGNSEAVSRLFPSSVTVTPTEIYHPFGGLTHIQTESSLGSANDLLAIKLERIPSRACLSLLQRVAPQGVYDMWVSAAGDNRLVALLPARTEQSPGRNTVSVAKARTLCNRASYVDITFRIIKHVDLPTMRRKNFGTSLSPEELARMEWLYNRQVAAMEAREAAQMSL